MIFGAKRNAFASPDMAGPREISLITLLAVIAAILCFVVFWLNPELDKETLRLFWSENDRFYLNDHAGIGLLRRLMFISIGVFYAFVAVGWIVAYVRQGTFLRLTWEKWCYLGVCGIAGPALWVNGVLKAYWGRGRPRDVEEFGGSLNYTDFWIWSDQCTKNCSFTSGEVAAVAMIFFSLALVLEKPKRQIVLVLGLIAGLVVAWMRMTAGAHFFSDTLMSIVFMALLAAGLYVLFFIRDGQWIANANAKQVAKLAEKSAESQ